MMKKLFMVLILFGLAAVNVHAAEMMDKQGNGVFQEQIQQKDPANKGWLTMSEKRIILKPDPSGKVHVQNRRGRELSSSAITQGSWVITVGYQQPDYEARVMNIYTNRIIVLREKMSEAELKRFLSQKR